MAHAKANKEGSYKNQFEINGVVDTDSNYLAQGKSLMSGSCNDSNKTNSNS